MLRRAAYIFVTLLLTAPMAQAEGRPVVVELFTSQGCSTCPPADALLAELSKDPQVIALALHVDYWDYLGWKDKFASPMHTARQRHYARVQNTPMIYTPQMMFNGAEAVVGHRRAFVESALRAHKSRPVLVDVSGVRGGGTVRLDIGQAKEGGPFVIHLISYRPRSTVAIKRGENAGRTLQYTNVVTHWRTLREWSGRYALTIETDDDSAEDLFVIVQRKDYGEIIGGARVARK